MRYRKDHKTKGNEGPIEKSAGTTDKDTVRKKTGETTTTVKEEMRTETHHKRARECVDFKEGYCWKGRNCKYVHDNRKRCWYYDKGFCRNDRNCEYKHEES